MASKEKKRKCGTCKDRNVGPAYTRACCILCARHAGRFHTIWCTRRQLRKLGVGGY